MTFQVRLLLLAAMSGEHILLVGPPGTAKSEVGRRMNKLISGTFFERLLTRFSVPEVGGPVCSSWEGVMLEAKEDQAACVGLAPLYGRSLQASPAFTHLTTMTAGAVWAAVHARPGGGPLRAADARLLA